MEGILKERSRATGERRSEDVQQNLRHIFNLCDHDQDGVVTVEEFRTLAQQHLDSAEVSEKRREKRKEGEKERKKEL